MAAVVVKFAEVYKDANGEWRFRLKAGNHEIIAEGESYKNRVDAASAALALAPDVEIREVQA